MKVFRRVLHERICIVFTLLYFVNICSAADQCAPSTWVGNLRLAAPKATAASRASAEILQAIAATDERLLASGEDVAPGQIRCRFTTVTGAEVNYYTCARTAQKYGITVEKFFEINPQVTPDCGNIAPRTVYCVDGYIEPVRAYDGLCGPRNGNATCIGYNLGQCCNAMTGRCGNSTEDCAPGNCYEGTCAGDKTYSTDGTCGVAHGVRQCAGKWGDCCHMNGTCGTGPQFCGLDVCQMGNCTRAAVPSTPVALGNTTDGTCGGPRFYTCGLLFGRCCNKNGICGFDSTDCGTGCNPKFGQCDGVSTSSSQTLSSTSRISSSSVAMSSTRASTSTTASPASTTRPSSSTTSAVVTSTRASTSTVVTSTSRSVQPTTSQAPSSTARPSSSTIPSATTRVSSSTTQPSTSSIGVSSTTRPISTTALRPSTTTTPTTTSPLPPAVSIPGMVCVAGYGQGNQIGLCDFACQYGYCPPGPCTCIGYGSQKPTPAATYPAGVPVATGDSSYVGLCSYCCNHGYCPPDACRWP